MKKPSSKIHFSENSSSKEARNEVTHHQSTSPSKTSSPPSAPSVGNLTASARLPESQSISFLRKAAASSPSTSSAPQARKRQRPASQNLSSSSAPASPSIRCESMSGSIGRTKSSSFSTSFEKKRGLGGSLGFRKLPKDHHTNPRTGLSQK